MESVQHMSLSRSTTLKVPVHAAELRPYPLLVLYLLRFIMQVPPSRGKGHVLLPL